jgi:hypothetical protein
VSGWPAGSTHVAAPARARWLAAERCLRRIHEHAGDAATIVAMVPARREARSWWRLPWPTEATLGDAARRAFPGAIVTIEPFGNERARRALAAGELFDPRHGLQLDRHDRGAPMLFALTIEPGSARQGAS